MKKNDAKIVVDSAVLAGKPIIKGTRIAVEHILRLFAEDESMEDILSEYPNLTREDIAAALQYKVDLDG